jgi:Na+/H+ antiporter NhaB
MGGLGLLAYLWLLTAALVPLGRLARSTAAGDLDWRPLAGGLAIGLIGYLVASMALSHAFSSHLLAAIGLSLAATRAAGERRAPVTAVEAAADDVACESAR